MYLSKFIIFMYIFYAFFVHIYYISCPVYVRRCVWILVNKQVQLFVWCWVLLSTSGDRGLRFGHNTPRDGGPARCHRPYSQLSTALRWSAPHKDEYNYVVYLSLIRPELRCLLMILPAWWLRPPDDSTHLICFLLTCQIFFSPPIFFFQYHFCYCF